MHLELGDLLIAPPKMPDLRFKKSVIMLTQQHQGGWAGLTINKPTPHTLLDLAREVDLNLPGRMNFPLYWGGPVNTTTVWMLHSSEWSMMETIEINEHWSMTSDEKMFACVADGDYPRHFRFMFGLCAWAPEQLEAELRGSPPWHHSSSWLIARGPSPDWLFEQDPADLWSNSTELCGHQAVNAWL